MFFHLIISKPLSRAAFHQVINQLCKPCLVTTRMDLRKVTHSTAVCLALYLNCNKSYHLCKIGHSRCSLNIQYQEIIVTSIIQNYSFSMVSHCNLLFVYQYFLCNQVDKMTSIFLTRILRRRRLVNGSQVTPKCQNFSLLSSMNTAIQLYVQAT